MAPITTHRTESHQLSLLQQADCLITRKQDVKSHFRKRTEHNQDPPHTHTHTYTHTDSSIKQCIKTNRITALTLISLASFLWDVGKQCKTRSDATNAASDQFIYCLLKECSNTIGIKKIYHPTTLKLEMNSSIDKDGKSIRHKWVKQA